MKVSELMNPKGVLLYAKIPPVRACPDPTVRHLSKLPLVFFVKTRYSIISILCLSKGATYETHHLYRAVLQLGCLYGSIKEIKAAKA